MHAPRLPDAVCIGASKCGTTSLHYYLHAHPEIGLPRSKEVHYFLDPGNWHRGVEWYRRQFPRGRVLVESYGGGYTQYPRHTGVPERMSAVLPSAKLIYMVRDPIERMLSRYVHDVCEVKETRSPEEAFAGAPTENRYVAESLYFMQLSRYLEYFEPKQFLIVEYEDFRFRRSETLARIFRFLGVADRFESSAFSVVRHPTSGKRRKSALGVAIHERFGRAALERVGRLPLPMRLQRALAHRADQALYWLVSEPMQRPVLSQELRARLVEHFEPDVKRLEEFAGRRFEHWLGDPAPRRREPSAQRASSVGVSGSSTKS